MTTAGSQPLVVETRYDGGLFRHLPARVWMLGLLLHDGIERSRYWLAGDKAATPLGESRFGAHCARRRGRWRAALQRLRRRTDTAHPARRP